MFDSPVHAWFRRVLTLAGTIVISTIPSPAAASVYGFGCITGNSASDCSILQSQLSVEVSGTGNMVTFLFRNEGPLSSSITDVYFDDGKPAALVGNPIIAGSSGVDFSANCSPGNLPGGKPYAFASSYCVQSNSPTQPSGVNPGEWLLVSYALQGTATFDSLIAAIEARTYNIGIHVQGFADGGSESGVLVPEPATLILVGSGLLLGLRRRRQCRF